MPTPLSCSTITSILRVYAIATPESFRTWLALACQAAGSPRVFPKGASGFVGIAGRGHEHVCRMTRRNMGVSPSAFINRVRLEHAAMLLGSSDLPVAEIAHDCGIENISHFFKLFRQTYGNTPGQYRRHLRLDPVQPRQAMARRAAPCA